MSKAQHEAAPCEINLRELKPAQDICRQMLKPIASGDNGKEVQSFVLIAPIGRSGRQWVPKNSQARRMTPANPIAALAVTPQQDF